MAIKIDLLPGYVRLRRILKWSLGVSVVVLSCVGSVLTVLYTQKKEDVKVAEADVIMWQGLATQADNKKREADSLEGTLAPYTENVKFFADATQTGPRRAAVLEMIKHFIMPNALISSIDITDGQKVNFVAGVVDSDAYKDLLLNMRLGTTGKDPAARFPTVWASNADPVGSGIPGYPVPLEQPAVLGGTEPVPKSFPLSIAIATQLRPELILTSPPIPGDTAPAPAAGQPGAAGSPGGSGSAPK